MIYKLYHIYDIKITGLLKLYIYIFILNIINRFNIIYIYIYIPESVILYLYHFLSY